MILKSVEVNSSGKFIYTHFVREKMEQCKHQRIYVKNPQRGKTMMPRERFH